MTNLISAISGQFSRSVLLSTLLPVTVFVLLVLVLVWPQLPGSAAVVGWAHGLDTGWKLAAISLVTILLTALLHSLNGPVVRFYEGYPWSDSWLGRWRTRVHRRRFESREAWWRGLRVLLRQPETKGLGDDFTRAEEHWNQLARDLNVLYPDEAGAVLPTRLGNVIRSFESYPWRQYRIRAISVWPRLVARIDEKYATQIADAKSAVDFMLNSSLLCATLALLVAGVRLLYPVGLASEVVLVPSLEVLALIVLSYGFYLAAIAGAGAWGALVRGAFDLYRGDLLAALGYSQKPRSLEEERTLWEGISSQLILSNLMVAPHPGYQEAVDPGPATGVFCEPGEVPLELARGVALPPSRRGLEVTVRIGNADPARTATRVTLVEALPDNWLYEWGSAHAPGDVEVSGVGPYRFRIRDLAPGEETLLTYRMLPRPR